MMDLDHSHTDWHHLLGTARGLSELLTVTGRQSTWQMPQILSQPLFFLGPLSFFRGDTERISSRPTFVWRFEKHSHTVSPLLKRRLGYYGQDVSSRLHKQDN